MRTKEDVQIINIEDELNQLWKLHANSNKLKACLFNLIIYTHDPQRSQYFREIVRMIMEQFPCRVIFIIGNEADNQSYLRVSASIEGLTNNQGMLCDQILVEAAGSYLNRVPFLVLPHLVSDLPIYLLWGQDPTTENTILPHLQKFATRLIFDSECAEDLHHFSKQMLARLSSTKIDMIDMNWARIGGWRDIVAQTFDNQERVRQLAASRHIKIIYNDLSSLVFSHLETQALYFQAWLAAQLQWNYKRMERKSDKIILYYEFENHPLRIVLQPQTRKEFPPEELIALEFSDEENYLSTLTRRTDTQVTVHCSTQYQCQLPFNLMLPNIRSGRTFMQEIFYQKPSNQYVRMLHLINRIEGE